MIRTFWLVRIAIRIFELYCLLQDSETKCYCKALIAVHCRKALWISRTAGAMVVTADNCYCKLCWRKLPDKTFVHNNGLERSQENNYAVKCFVDSTFCTDVWTIWNATLMNFTCVIFSYGIITNVFRENGIIDRYVEWGLWIHHKRKLANVVKRGHHFNCISPSPPPPPLHLEAIQGIFSWLALR